MLETTALDSSQCFTRVERAQGFTQPVRQHGYCFLHHVDGGGTSTSFDIQRGALANEMRNVGNMNANLESTYEVSAPNETILKIQSQNRAKKKSSIATRRCF
jgi:hypothetical protein